MPNETDANGSPAVPSGPPPAPIDLNDETVVSNREFSGEFTVDESLNGQYGPQWHYAIKPLEFELGGKTGAYHMYIGTDKRGPRTKFGIIVKALRLAMGDTQPSKIGASELVGRQMMFVEKDMSFGKDRETGEMREATWIIPLRLLTEEDEARIRDTGSVVRQMPTTTFTDEQTEAILSVVLGETEDSVTPKAARSRLPQELKASVLSGEAIPALIKAGVLVVEDSGKYARMPF